MKSTVAGVFVAVALSLGAGTLQGAEQTVTNSSSVADMLQRKHDTQVRATLVSENRWAEIRQLDAVTAQRLNAQNNAALERGNQQLARDTGADGPPINNRALECAADAMRVR